MMHDPQNDWSEDGTCPDCGGYALVAGNGRDVMVTISCEGDCGTYAGILDAEDGLVRYTPPKPALRVATPAEDAWAEDEPF